MLKTKKTKSGWVIETTNRVYGMLEQGGTIGRRVLYTFGTLKRLGVSAQDRPNDEWCECCTIEQYVDRNGTPDKVIRKGHVIN